MSLLSPAAYFDRCGLIPFQQRIKIFKQLYPSVLKLSFSGYIVAIRKGDDPIIQIHLPEYTYQSCNPKESDDLEKTSNIHVELRPKDPSDLSDLEAYQFQVKSFYQNINMEVSSFSLFSKLFCTFFIPLL